MIERLYRRIGSRVILVVIAAWVGLSAIAALSLELAACRYLKLSVAHTLPLALVFDAVLLSMCVVGTVFGATGVRTILAWRDERRTPERAAETWEGIASMPSFLTRGGLWGVPVGAAGLLIATAHFGQPWWIGTLFLLAGALGYAACWIANFFVGELLMRPMAEQVVAQLPHGYQPLGRGVPLRARALGPVLIVVAFDSLVLGSVYDLVPTGPSRAALAVGIAFAGLIVAGVFFDLVTRSYLGPIRQLRTAMDRVRAGDLSQTVLITTGDELGLLARGFNQMLFGLREREALQSELQASRSRIVAAADEERRRLERDLHDGAQQHLVLLGLELDLLDRTLNSDPAAAKAIVEQLRGELRRAQSELRDLAHGIYPPLLESDGLPGALSEAANRSALPATFDSGGTGRHRPELEAAVYFCCLEALQNAAKHAGPEARTTVTVGECDGRLEFAVADNGHGFDAANGASAGAGLQNMHDRIGALGGTLAITSTPGNGTTVAGTIPLSDLSTPDRASRRTP